MIEDISEPALKPLANISGIFIYTSARNLDRNKKWSEDYPIVKAVEDLPSGLNKRVFEHYN
jgi:hypothetical protein